MRHTSESLAAALARGICDGGADVIDIGLCGTEEVYFATFQQQAGGGIMVTASHNPPEYNGMKFVREDARPISGDDGLPEIERLAYENKFSGVDSKGTIRELQNRDAYVDFLCVQANLDTYKPLKIVVNAGNGCAGLVLDAIEKRLPFEFIKLHHAPDGDFPHGVPNPLLTANRQPTIDAIKQHGADLGLAWDGDFDRCFFFDETGAFIEGYYIVGLLAKVLLANNPGEAIVYDPRLTWNTLQEVQAAGGTPVQSKSGHAFIKARMREVDGLYGGEMSAHHYFREFAYCDNGTLPWLLMCELLSVSGQPLSSLVKECIAAFPASGEINRKVADADVVIADIEARYVPEAVLVDRLDGLGVEFEQWRFNLRKSNTEPVIRLNVESRANPALMQEKTAELLALIGGSAG